MNSQTFFRHAVVYGTANLLVQASGFLLLPLYTKYLGPADYGVLEVLGRLAETTATLLMIGGARQAMFTFYQQAGDEAERRRVVTATLLFLGGLCGVGGLLMMAFAGAISDALSAFGPGLRPDLLRLAVLAVLLEPLSLVPLTLIQSRVESTRYVLVTVSQFVVRATLCVVLVAWLDWGVAGVLAATALTCAAYGVYLTGRELARGAARPHWADLGALVRFTLPFLPGGICFFVMQHGDRFFLLHYRGQQEVGTYALGYKLALAVGTFSMMPLYQVWGARMYAVARMPDGPVAFGRAFTRILAAFVAVGLGLCVLQDEVVRVLGHNNPGYAPASRVIAVVVLACFCQTASTLMDAGLYVRRRTGLKLGVTLAATALMLTLYFAWIPPYGSMGAAAATLVGFAFHAACTWGVTQRVYPVRYEWGRVAAMVALAAAVWAASRLLPFAVWAVPVKLGLWTLWPLLVWQTGLMSREEKQYALSLTGETWNALRRHRRPPAPPAAAPRPEAAPPAVAAPVP